MFRVINTNMLELLILLDTSGDVEARRSNRRIIIARIVIIYGGLTDILSARRFRLSELLTMSKSGGVDFVPPGREGRESLLVVDTDGAVGSCRQVRCQLGAGMESCNSKRRIQ